MPAAQHHRMRAGLQQRGHAAGQRILRRLELVVLAHHVAGVDQATQIVRRQAGHHAPDGARRQRRAALVARHAGIAGKAQHRGVAGAGVLPQRDDVGQAARIAALAAVVARGPDGRGIVGHAHAAPAMR